MEGTPQGAVISPLLANVYLHYVYDLWVRQWRQRHARGDVIVVRYADDTIIGFEHQQDAERFLADLSARLAEFGLGLHPDKTRLIEFGRNAIANHRSRGLGKPKTFDFLGFTHYCATRRSGSGFVLGRANERAGDHCVSSSPDRTLASCRSATRPEASVAVATDEADRQSLSAISTHPPPMA